MSPVGQVSFEQISNSLTGAYMVSDSFFGLSLSVDDFQSIFEKIVETKPAYDQNKKIGDCQVSNKP